MATQTSGPWEQYSSQTPEHGPWEEYASATPSEAELKAPPLNTEGIQISPHPGATIGPGEPASPANNFEGSGKFRGANPFERYMDEAENLTYEGAKQHPIQNFIGQTAKRGREFGNILSTMGMLFMGPGGTAPAEGVAPPAAQTPVWKGQVPGAVPSAPESPANAISTPQEHIWHPANPKVEGPLTEEGNLSSGPSAEAAQPAAGPQREPTMKDLGQQIEQAAGYDRNAPIYRRPQGTVGAQTVGEQPNIEVAGPRIQTPSRNETLT